MQADLPFTSPEAADPACNLLLESLRPKAGDPTFDGYKGLENADPHVFYILDTRTDLKPRGWS